jgi:hypothetical protein
MASLKDIELMAQWKEVRSGVGVGPGEVAVIVGVLVAVGVIVSVGVMLGVAVLVGVSVSVEVDVLVAVPVGVAVGPSTAKRIITIPDPPLAP